MLVVVVAMRCVPMAVMDVVQVPIVLDGPMSTPFAVHVVVVADVVMAVLMQMCHGPSPIVEKGESQVVKTCGGAKATQGRDDAGCASEFDVTGDFRCRSPLDGSDLGHIRVLVVGAQRIGVRVARYP